MRVWPIAPLVVAVTLAACGGSTLDGAVPEPRDPGVGAPSNVATAEVLEVVDGDTLEVAIGTTTERLRLIGVDAPERGECYADEATRALSGLVAGREVALVADTSERDRYDRLLHYVFLDGTHVNAELVRRGAAVAREYPPDTDRSEELRDAEAAARAAGRGLWSACR